MNEKHSAKYSFYYILSLIALIFLGISVGLVIFTIINKSIVDPLLDNYYSYRGMNSSLRFAISAILIAAPIYYYSVFLINRGLKKEEISFGSGVRKWLTYSIILAASLIILGVFVSIINKFLAGGLSMKFFLQALTVFLIAALVFSYYFYDIKNNNEKNTRIVKRIFFYSSLVLVIAVFTSAWFFVESPKVARERRLDDYLINNISSLKYQIDDYYYKNNTLPTELTDLKATNSFNHFDLKSLVDPATGEPIVYNKLSDLEFELCAVFITSNLDDLDNYQAQHDAGYYCINNVMEKRDDRVKETEVILKD